MLKTLICILVFLSTMALSSRVYGLGMDYPTDQPVNLQQVPPGLNELINQKSRVHGYLVNGDDLFFFTGDAVAFEAFLKQYAALDGIAGHRLTIHAGRGQAKSPWDKGEKGEAKACDWMLEVALVRWREGGGEKVFMDPKSTTEKPRYMSELHVWSEGNVELAKVKIPETIRVVREEPAAPKSKDSTGSQEAAPKADAPSAIEKPADKRK